MDENDFGTHTRTVMKCLVLLALVTLGFLLGLLVDTVSEQEKEPQPGILDNGMWLDGVSGGEVVLYDPTPTVGRMYPDYTITLDSSLPDGTYILKYEDENGMIAKYATVCSPMTPGETYDAMIPQNMIPQEAKRIGVYTAAGVKVGKIEFPETAKIDTGDLLYRFGVLSDVHIGYGDAHYARALSYLTEEENVEFITVAGDLTDSCTEWEAYRSIVEQNANGVPVYEIPGNHDTAYWRAIALGENYTNEDITEYTSAIKEMIETYTGDSLYYSFTKGDDVFIMVGVQSNYGGRMFTWEELQWLYETLEANRDKRCFLFQHVLPDTASGNANQWSDKEDMAGTEQTVFTSLLTHYPNVILFHGHTHQSLRLQMEAEDANYDVDFGVHSIHIPSVGGTRGPLPSDNGSSQGYVVEVYENGIVLKGMNLRTGKYFPVAQYYLETPIWEVEPNTFLDRTNTVNCEKVDLGWMFETHVDKSTGVVTSRAEYAASKLIQIESGKTYYFHTFYDSPYLVDVCCYDADGAYLGSFTGPWEEDLYQEPVELNAKLPVGTASIRLRMWTGMWYEHKTVPIFITAVPTDADNGVEG